MLKIKNIAFIILFLAAFASNAQLEKHDAALNYIQKGNFISDYLSDDDKKIVETLISNKFDSDIKKRLFLKSFAEMKNKL